MKQWSLDQYNNLISTPVGYRTRQESARPEPFNNTVSLSERYNIIDVGDGGAKTGMTRELQQTKMTPPKLEPVEKGVARGRVTMGEFDSSDIFFKKRSKSLPRHIGRQEKFLIEV